MRLVGYFVLELAVGISLLAGAAGGVYFGGRELLSARPALAWPIQEAEILVEDEPIAAAELEMPPLERPASLAPLRANTGYFLGIHDEVLLAPLRAGKVSRTKFNRGGSSVSLRLDFEGGGRAAFKPDQTNLQSIPRKEVAAYRLNRMLGLSSVSPCVPRAIPRQDVIAGMDVEARQLLPRFQAEVTGKGGMVTGSLCWWIPEIRDASIDGYLIDSTDGIVVWKRHLTVGEAMPREHRMLLPQIAELVAFDFLINNMDRWSGGNAKASPDGRWLYFMDNALSFGTDPDGHEKVRTYLMRSQKFSRSLYVALRQLTAERIREVMTQDTGPYERLLGDREIEAVLARRDYMLGYIDELIDAHGEAAVLVFP